MSCSTGRISSDGHHVAVADYGGEVAGHVSCHQQSVPETAWGYPRQTMVVDELVVGEQHRRQGIGGRLVDYVRGRAARQGCGEVRLSVWRFNQQAAAFFAAVGFEAQQTIMAAPAEPVQHGDVNRR